MQDPKHTPFGRKRYQLCTIGRQLSLLGQQRILNRRRLAWSSVFFHCCVGPTPSRAAPNRSRSSPTLLHVPRSFLYLTPFLPPCYFHSGELRLITCARHKLNPGKRNVLESSTRRKPRKRQTRIAHKHRVNNGGGVQPICRAQVQIYERGKCTRNNSLKIRPRCRRRPHDDSISVKSAGRPKWPLTEEPSLNTGSGL